MSTEIPVGVKPVSFLLEQIASTSHEVVAYGTSLSSPHYEAGWGPQRALYAALRDRVNPDDGVFCAVVLYRIRYRWTPIRGILDREIWWKTMDETAGPFDTDCPKRVFAALTEHKRLNDHARNWRAEVAARLDSAVNVAAGDTVVFDETLRFKDGTERQHLVFVSGDTFTAADKPGTSYVIRRWKQYPYTVQKAERIRAGVVMVDGRVKRVTVAKTDGSALQSLQRLVGGDIEAVTVEDFDVSCFVNEEGKLRRQAKNPAATRLVGGGDWIAGPMVVVGSLDASGEITDLDENILAEIRQTVAAGNPAITTKTAEKLSKVDSRPVQRALSTNKSVPEHIRVAASLRAEVS